MKERIITVGNSPLAFLTARELDRAFGDLVHRDLLWISQSPQQVHLSSQSSIFHLKTLDQKNQTAGTKILTEGIKAVRLKDRQIISDKRVLDYDYLILDQTPAYTFLELKTIAGELTTLLTNLQAQQRLRRGQPVQISCQGKSTQSWQLALLIRASINRFYPVLSSQVEVVVDQPVIDITAFLKKEGIKISSKRTALPGLRIAPPQRLIDPQKIKGLRLDASGRAMTHRSYSPEGYPEVLLFDQESGQLTNILKVWQTQAKQITAHLRRQLEREAPIDWQLPSRAVLLNGQDRSYLSLGNLESQRTRAQIVRQLDNRLHRRLL